MKKSKFTEAQIISILNEQSKQEQKVADGFDFNKFDFMVCWKTSVPRSVFFSRKTPSLKYTNISLEGLRWATPS